MDLFKDDPIKSLAIAGPVLASSIAITYDIAFFTFSHLASTSSLPCRLRPLRYQLLYRLLAVSS
jgi:hypothetical protein